MGPEIGLSNRSAGIASSLFAALLVAHFTLEVRLSAAIRGEKERLKFLGKMATIVNVFYV